MFMNLIFCNLLYVLEIAMFYFCPNSLRENIFLNHFNVSLDTKDAGCWIY